MTSAVLAPFAAGAGSLVAEGEGERTEDGCIGAKECGSERSDDGLNKVVICSIPFLGRT